MVIDNNKKTFNTLNKSTSSIGIPSIFFKNKSILSFMQLSNFPVQSEARSQNLFSNKLIQSIYNDKVSNRIQRSRVPDQFYYEEQKKHACKIIESKKRKFNEDNDNCAQNKKVCTTSLVNEENREQTSFTKSIEPKRMKNSFPQNYTFVRTIDKEFTLRDESFLLNPYLFEKKPYKPLDKVSIVENTPGDLKLEDIDVGSKNYELSVLPKYENDKIINLNLHTNELKFNQYKTRSVTQLLKEIDNHRLVLNKNKKSSTHNITKRFQNIKTLMSDALPSNGIKDENMTVKPIEKENNVVFFNNNNSKLKILERSNPSSCNTDLSNFEITQISPQKSTSLSLSNDLNLYNQNVTAILGKNVSTIENKIKKDLALLNDNNFQTLNEIPTDKSNIANISLEKINRQINFTGTNKDDHTKTRSILNTQITECNSILSDKNDIISESSDALKSFPFNSQVSKVSRFSNSKDKTSTNVYQNINAIGSFGNLPATIPHDTMIPIIVTQPTTLQTCSVYLTDFTSTLTSSLPNKPFDQQSTSSNIELNSNTIISNVNNMIDKQSISSNNGFGSISSAINSIYGQEKVSNNNNVFGMNSTTSSTMFGQTTDTNHINGFGLNSFATNSTKNVMFGHTTVSNDSGFKMNNNTTNTLFSSPITNNTTISNNGFHMNNNTTNSTPNTLFSSPTTNNTTISNNYGFQISNKTTNSTSNTLFSSPTTNNGFGISSFSSNSTNNAICGQDNISNNNNGFGMNSNSKNIIFGQQTDSTNINNGFSMNCTSINSSENNIFGQQIDAKKQTGFGINSITPNATVNNIFEQQSISNNNLFGMNSTTTNSASNPLFSQQALNNHNGFRLSNNAVTNVFGQQPDQNNKCSGMQATNSIICETNTSSNNLFGLKSATTNSTSNNMFGQQNFSNNKVFGSSNITEFNMTDQKTINFNAGLGTNSLFVQQNTSTSTSLEQSVGFGTQIAASNLFGTPTTKNNYASTNNMFGQMNNRQNLGFGQASAVTSSGITEQETIPSNTVFGQSSNISSSMNNTFGQKTNTTFSQAQTPLIATFVSTNNPNSVSSSNIFCQPFTGNITGSNMFGQQLSSANLHFGKKVSVSNSTLQNESNSVFTFGNNKSDLQNFTLNKIGSGNSLFGQPTITSNNIFGTDPQPNNFSMQTPKDPVPNLQTKPNFGQNQSSSSTNLFSFSQVNSFQNGSSPFSQDSQSSTHRRPTSRRRK